MSQTKQRLSEGFTLIEVLIIAPIVMLVIGGFVALIIAMVGDVLLTRDQNVMAYETQDALDRIEQDTRIGTQFLNTSRTLTAPQGSNDGTAAFSSSNALIMGALATDKNPASPDRQLIYYADQPNACGSAGVTQNRVFINKIIYYVKNNSLWRRVIVPPYNTNSPSDLLTTCGDPWQQNSCSPGYTLTPPCQANDSEVMKNVQTFNVKYYDDPSATTELTGDDILSASTIDVTIIGTRTTTGKVATTSGTVRASKLNSIEADVPPPTTPVVSHIVGDSPRPNVNFSWGAVPNATSYKVSYSIDGGSVINDTVPGGTTYYNVAANRNQLVDFTVASVNASGTSPDANDSATLPPWTYVDLLNDWVVYAPNTFQSPAYTITPDGVVVLKGLIKDGLATNGTPLFTLPPGYRPEKRLIFSVGSYNSGSGFGRIDVLPNGDVVFVAGQNGWISLDSIHFMPQSTAATWTTLTLSNNWAHYNGPAPTDTYSQLMVTKDAETRVHVHGLVRSGTTASNTVIGTLPANFSPSQYAIFPGSDNGTFTAFGVTSSSFGASANSIVSRGLYTSYIPTQAMYYPSSYNGWQWFTKPDGVTLANTSPYTLYNNWTWYNASGYATPQFTKQDGIVTVKGLMKSGTTTNGTTIAVLPPGFRPIKKMIFPALGAAVAGNGGHTRLDVTVNGEIKIEGGIAASNYLSLDSISFIAED